ATTLIAAEPVFPSLVAVIVAVPSATAVTKPVDVTDATVGALDVQVTCRPRSTLPLASLRVATSCWLRPTTTVRLSGATATDATGAVDGAVVPVAILDRSPNTAFAFSAPRNATSWKSYTVPGGGRGATVIVAAPLRPLLVAVMVADPGATAVTRPVAVTVATPVLLLDHLTVGLAPEPDASPTATAATVNLTVSPTETL